MSLPLKGFKEKVELQYRDKQNQVKGTKSVKVAYDWKPEVCSHCVVFGHDHKNCKVRPRSEEEITNDKVESSMNNNGESGDMQSKIRKFPMNPYQNRQGYFKYGNNKNVNKSKPFQEVKQDLDDENIQAINMMKDKMIVDKYLNMRMQPSFNVTKDWSHEMVNYFKRSWEANREKEKDISLDEIEGIVEDLLDDDSEAIRNLVTDEVNGVGHKLKDVCGKVFGQWDWISNIAQCNGGCRISFRHGNPLPKMEDVELLLDGIVIWCKCFIYADNKGMDRRILWNDLQIAKCSTVGYPWVIIGDFNVTLNVEEHSAGRSTISNDMQDFIDCVNNIGVEDLCMSGMFYTWIKSPFNPNTSILKKLDRVMANDELTTKYNNAHVVFHLFIVSDHSPAVLIFPNAMTKRKKSFKFANFITDKKDFLPIVDSVWKIQLRGFYMFQLVKKLKLLKKQLNRLQWKNSDVFDRVICLRNKLKAAKMNLSIFPHDNDIKEDAATIFEEYSKAISDEESCCFKKLNG
ncbi:RNA-directed DNA polymerase, eukaryota, reverse transcriptase zinc-binding domain protein [Tanacetum coccineum]